MSWLNCVINAIIPTDIKWATEVVTNSPVEDLVEPMMSLRSLSNDMLVVVPDDVTFIPVQKKLHCVNGVEDEFASTPACICFFNYKGHCCDTQIDANISTYYEQILNGTFDIDTYAPQKWANAKFVSKGKFFKMLSLDDPAESNETLIDYNSFIDTIVGNYWKLIDPQGTYMRTIDYDCFWNGTNVGSQVQQMKLYTQRISQGMTRNFRTYRQALKLIAGLFKNSSDVILRKASEFGKTQLYSNFTQWEVEIKQEVGLALNWTCALYADYGAYVKEGVDMTNDTQAKLMGILWDIKNSTFKYYDMVNDYGYWYLINKLNSTIKPKYGKVSFYI